MTNRLSTRPGDRSRTQLGFGTVKNGIARFLSCLVARSAARTDGWGKLSREENKWTFSFPKDHGKHPAFATEWWYVSGNLESPDGKEWGYQFAMFRHSPSVNIGSGWYLRFPMDGYMSQLAITNAAERIYIIFQKWGCPIFGHFGADESSLNVWMGQWTLTEQHGRMLLEAEQDGCGVYLEMVSLKPPVLNGHNGFAVKEPGGAGISHHYSLTSLQTQGTIKWQGDEYSVRGKSWLDREFGSQIFPKNIRGWDWLSLRLDNDHEIMIMHIRPMSGVVSPTSYGTTILPDGTWNNLNKDDFEISTSDFWTSKRTKARYPMGWKLELPSEDAALDVQPIVKDHELYWLPRWKHIDYWEGPVRITGTMHGKRVSGKGYVELVGYTQPIGGRF
jgi:predicted secreted hydrolase